jgi:hypothetical protein
MQFRRAALIAAGAISLVQENLAGPHEVAPFPNKFCPICWWRRS